MKRGVFDILRRGLDNTIANWQLLLIRVAEMFLFVALAIGTVVVILIPIFVSIGIRIADLKTPEDISSAVLSMTSRWALLLWILGAVFVLLGVFVAVHAFVEAGCARVYVDGEQMAGPLLDGPRARYAAFSADRWALGARQGWWALFWIYNAAYGVIGLVLLVPLIPTAVLMFVFREQPALLAASGCLGLVAVLVLAIVGGIIAGAWVNRAIVEWCIRRSSASDALSEGWRAFRADLGRHLLIALAVIVVAIAASSFFAGISFGLSLGASFRSTDYFGAFFTMPARLVLSAASWFVSAGISGWYVASYAALAMEPRQ